MDRTPRSQRLRRAGLACVAAALAVPIIGLTTTALATTSSGVKGSPQPELKQFTIGTSDGGSSSTIDFSSGNLIVAYEIGTKNTEGAIKVCVMKRGARSCESTTTLYTEKGSSVFGEPFVTVGDGGVVYVAMDECCYANYLLFKSTDGGKSFGSPTQLGVADSPGFDNVEAFGVKGGSSNIIWDEDDAGKTLQVEYAPFNSDGTVVTAMTDKAEFNSAGIGSYDGGVLAAGTDFNNETRVAFAPAFSTTFHSVGTFKKQDLIGLSGSALLTKQTTGKENLELYLFNGTSFGSAHTVPKGGGGGPYWDFLQQGFDGTRTFVFTERNQDSYDLEGQTTTNGSSWTPRWDLGNAVKSTGFSATIDSIGSGIIVGTSGPVTVWPIMATQSVSFSLSRSKVQAGTSVKATGKGSSPASGRTVWLQELKSGTWDNIATTHENSSGDFSFKFSTSSAGTYQYRAEVDEWPGYLQYGYSGSQSLQVVAKS